MKKGKQIVAQPDNQVFTLADLVDWSWGHKDYPGLSMDPAFKEIWYRCGGDVLAADATIQQAIRLLPQTLQFDHHITNPEELPLEQVAAFLRGSAIAPRKTTTSAKATSSDFRRYCYDRMCAGVKLCSIRREVKDRFGRKISSDPGISQAAKRYATDAGKPWPIARS